MDEDEKTFDAFKNELVHGDTVITTKDLKLKGTKKILKKGTVVKNIHLTDDPEEIDCPKGPTKGLVLRSEFVRKK